MDTNTQSLQACATRKLKVTVDYWEDFLNPVTMENKVDVELLYDNIVDHYLPNAVHLTTLLDHIEISEMTEDTYKYVRRDVGAKHNATFHMDKPNQIDAFFTFMLSGYFKERKNTATYTRFGIDIPDTKPYYFYSLKNYTGNLPPDTIIDTNVLQASVYWLNQRVVSMRDQGLSGMTALSRVTFSEQNIADIASLFDVDVTESIKFCNTAMVRKPYQFGNNYPYYDAELADNEKVIDLMQHVTGKVGELPVEEIFQRFTNEARKPVVPAAYPKAECIKKYVKTTSNGVMPALLNIYAN